MLHFSANVIDAPMSFQPGLWRMESTHRLSETFSLAFPLIAAESSMGMLSVAVRGRSPSA